MQQAHKRSFPCAELHKSCGQNRASQTGYETWICELGKKTFVNLDVEVNEKRVPLNQKSKLNHESISSSTWKLGTLEPWIVFFVWTRPYFLQIGNRLHCTWHARYNTVGISVRHSVSPYVNFTSIPIPNYCRPCAQ
jgi:hypothetical protein